MKITSMEEYGLRCMMQLAMADAESPVTVAEVADQEGLSTEYAGKLLNQLRQSELVDSVRGRNGGFVLAKPADEVSVLEILNVFSTDLFDSEYCERHTGNEEICVHDSSCTLRPIWWTLSRIVARTLGDLTLMDLLRGELELQRDLEPRLDTVPGGAGRSIYRIHRTEGPDTPNPPPARGGR